MAWFKVRYKSPWDGRANNLYVEADSESEAKVRFQLSEHWRPGTQLGTELISIEQDDHKLLPKGDE